MGTACINGNCTDPCIGFDECGANAVCETVSHSATCKCPNGTRELNSPYVACVPAEMDLSTISCLRDSDCSFGLTCQDWQCRPASNRRKRKLKSLRWLYGLGLTVNTTVLWKQTYELWNYYKKWQQKPFNLLKCWKVWFILLKSGIITIFRVLFCTSCIIFFVKWLHSNLGRSMHSGVKFSFKKIIKMNNKFPLRLNYSLNYLRFC